MGVNLRIYEDGVYREVGGDYPLPTRETPLVAAETLLGVPFQGDLLLHLANSGRLFVASDADEDDYVTGQTSFAATSPTFALAVPTGYSCLPLFVNLGQAGTVAGGPITVAISVDARVQRISSGTAETAVRIARNEGAAQACTFYSTATAVAATAGNVARLWSAVIGQDVSPAEGAVQGPYWKPELPYILQGPATLLVYTWAGTTGPTWAWSVGWAEWPTGAA